MLVFGLDAGVAEVNDAFAEVYERPKEDIFANRRLIQPEEFVEPKNHSMRESQIVSATGSLAINS